MATKIVTPEMSAAVGKTFAIKMAEGDAANRRFKVAGLVAAVDFGSKRGGRQPAFIVHRVGYDSESTPSAEQFLAEYEEVATGSAGSLPAPATAKS
jgi:hypothetical protein